MFKASIVDADKIMGGYGGEQTCVATCNTTASNPNEGDPLSPDCSEWT